LGFRPDIQGLRALAVLLVLFSHAFPGTLEGGFLGVDVFFVVSGYLIIGLIAAELARDEGFRFARFYARRAGRLLPLAVLVLIFTGLITRFFLSPFLQEDAARHLTASGLYCLNWVLIGDAANYAARDEGASPFQQFWTLAVEEQFYVVIPVVLVLAWRLGGQRAVVGALVGTAATSLGLALAWIPDSPAAGYYNTFLRAWEFAAGGLLAVLGVRVRRHRFLVQVVGLALVAGVVLLANNATRTPGPTTPLLVAGVGLLIATAPHGPRTPVDAVLGARPMQHLGNTSYGIYLWHWPVLLLSQELLPDAPMAVQGTAGIGASLLLAALTQPAEDRVRASVNAQAGTPRRAVATAATLAASSAAVALTAGMLLTHTAQGGSTEPATANSTPSPAAPDEPVRATPCVGAVALEPGADCAPSKQVRPDPLRAREDMPYEECKESLTGDAVITCEIGEGQTRVALVGDSHAQRLVPALEPLLPSHDWHLTTYLKSSCTFSATRPVDYAKSCTAWNEAVMEELLAGDYDLVITQSSAGNRFPAGADGTTGAHTAADGMAEHWERLEEAGTSVVAVRDSPQPGFARIDPPRCVLNNGPTSPACAADVSSALLEDPAVLAAEQGGAAKLIDLTDSFCTNDACPSVIGGVLVYRDGQHVHSAYAATLAPILDAELTQILPEP